MDQATRNMLLEYAAEDLQLARDRGYMAISNTHIGCIHIDKNGKGFDISAPSHGIHMVNVCWAAAVVFIAKNFVVEGV
jgi:hypothetical protein|tara:strand:+ start:260 stop:493 length:234 start_codon:yes stop_codon:yes gene_type:complete